MKSIKYLIVVLILGTTIAFANPLIGNTISTDFFSGDGSNLTNLSTPGLNNSISGGQLYANDTFVNKTAWQGSLDWGNVTFATTQALLNSTTGINQSISGLTTGISEYSYFIYQNNTFISAKNGSNSTVEFTSTDLNLTVNTVINSMNPNRGKKEKVIIKGNYTLSSPINVSDKSYLIFEISQANFSLSDSVNDDMFKLTNVTNIDIIGGFFEGNRYNQGGSSGSGIRINGVSNRNIHISDVNIANVSRYGIFAQNISNILLENLVINDIGTTGSEGRGIYLLSGQDAFVKNMNGTNFTRYGIVYYTIDFGGIEDSQISNATGDRGIYVTNSKNIKIINDIASFNNLAGFAIADSIDSSIIESTANNNTFDGLLIQGDLNLEEGNGRNYSENIRVSGGSFLYNQRDGVRIQALNSSMVAQTNVIGAQFNRNGAVGVNLNGVGINNTGVYLNTFKNMNDAANRAVRVANARGTQIRNNDMSDNVSTTILLSGDVRTAMSDNVGVNAFNWGYHTDCTVLSTKRLADTCFDTTFNLPLIYISPNWLSLVTNNTLDGMNQTFWGAFVNISEQQGKDDWQNTTASNNYDDLRNGQNQSNGTQVNRSALTGCSGGQYTRWDSTTNTGGCFADLGGTNLTFTYVVRTDGQGNYYAKGTATGQDDYSGTNFTDVVNSAIANSSCASGCTILIRAGTYYANYTIEMTPNYRNGIVLMGEGMATVIVMNNIGMDGIHMGLNSTASQPLYNRIKDLQITSSNGTYGQATTGQTNGKAINLDSVALTEISNVLIQYPYIGIYSYNSTDVYIDGVTIQYVRITDGVSIWINGLTFGGSEGSNSIYISRSLTNSPFGEPYAGIRLQNVGGFDIHNTDIINSGNGLLIDPTANQVVKYGYITASASDSNSGYGTWINPTSGGAVKSIHFTDWWSTTNDQIGMYLQGNTDGITVINSRLMNNVNSGIQWDAGVQDVKVSESTISGNSRSTKDYASGIYVSAGAMNFSIQNNRIGATEGYLNRQLCGIWIANGSSNGYEITGNDLNNNSACSLYDGGTGEDKFIYGNINYSGNSFSRYGYSVNIGSAYFGTNAANAVVAFGYNIKGQSNNTNTVPDVTHKSAWFQALDATNWMLRGYITTSNGNATGVLTFGITPNGNLTVFGDKNKGGGADRSGITLYDENKNPMCIQTYSNGTVRAANGACA